MQRVNIPNYFKLPAVRTVQRYLMLFLLNYWFVVTFLASSH